MNLTFKLIALFLMTFIPEANAADIGEEGASTVDSILKWGAIGASVGLFILYKLTKMTIKIFLFLLLLLGGFIAFKAGLF